MLAGVIAFKENACEMGLSHRSALPEAARQLLKDLNLPLRLGELGVAMADIEPLVSPAFEDHSTPGNPREATEQDCRALFKAAL